MTNLALGPPPPYPGSQPNTFSMHYVDSTPSMLDLGVHDEEDGDIDDEFGLRIDDQVRGTLPNTQRPCCGKANKLTPLLHPRRN